MYLDEVTAADWDDDQIDTELNYAYMEMYTAVVETYEDYYRKISTLDMVPGQQQYELPDDFFKLRRLEIKYFSTSDYYKAMKYSFDQIGMAFDSVNIGSSARPTYDITGDYLRILPVAPSDADGSLRLTYIKVISELESDTDVIEIPFPDRFAKYIVKGACGELLRKGQQEETVALQYDNQFQMGLEKMKQELEDRYADGPRMILDTAGQNNNFGSSGVTSSINIT